ncbi:MAG: acyl carrier protein [Aeoliella sp.]
MTQTEFLHLVDQILEVPPGTIALGDEFQQHEGWTSLTFLGLIAVVDEELGVTLAPNSILACATVEDLLGLVGDSISDERAAA